MMAWCPHHQPYESAPSHLADVMKLASDATCNELFSMAELPDEEVSLIDALLLSVRYANSACSIAEVKQTLDVLGERVEPRIAQAEGVRDKLDVLTEFLFEECGFQGNRDEYYDPRNSYVNKVLERKRGLPITLSVIYIEVARRVGLELAAISFPFHFLISPIQVEDLYLDPFHNGQQLSRIDCKRMLEEFSEGTVPFQPCYLEPATARQVVLRVMRNLKIAHLRKRETFEAISCIDVMLAWNPGQPKEIRDRGLLYAQMKVWSLAIRDFEAYLEECPSARDRLRIELELANARRERLDVN